MYESLIDSIFGRGPTGTFFKSGIGILSMGLLGYGVYYGIKSLTSPSESARADTGEPVTAQPGGQDVVWNGTSWVPRPKPQAQSASTISSSSSSQKITGGVYANSVQNSEDPHQVYQSAFDSFNRSKANGTLAKQTLTGSSWTTKYLTDDGTVIVTDAKGNVGTQDSAGNWVVTNSAGQYVTTVTSKKVTVAPVEVSRL